MSWGCIFEADAGFGAIILPGAVLETFSKPSLFLVTSLGRCVDNCCPLDPAVGGTQCSPGPRSTHTTGLGHLGQVRNTCAGHPWHPWGHEGVSGGLGVGGRGAAGWRLLEHDVKERAFIPFFLLVG